MKTIDKTRDFYEQLWAYENIRIRDNLRANQQWVRRKHRFKPNIQRHSFIEDPDLLT